MNMLNALHILGFGGFWASGANSHDARVREALGFEPHDRLVGLLYVGTPVSAGREALRPPRNRFVREWQPGQDLVQGLALALSSSAADEG
jgi:nitroreductase